jgi:hypothetical protein
MQGAHRSIEEMVLFAWALIGIPSWGHLLAHGQYQPTLLFFLPHNQLEDIDT